MKGMPDEAAILINMDMDIALKIPIIFGNEESPSTVTFQKIEEIKPPISEDLKFSGLY
ncbi:hypothetical protein C1645_822018 [Glomus cerebriforme]|uniref:Uncharacterized protein n=1 Tax=Glomus cerebriforme TaxID=658196 RepID=A0A397T0R8_9GLOM|nr:hypothetical protein C1645_822018 [Glomus cerebriforme]